MSLNPLNPTNTLALSLVKAEDLNVSENSFNTSHLANNSHDKSHIHYEFARIHYILEPYHPDWYDLDLTLILFFIQSMKHTLKQEYILQFALFVLFDRLSTPTYKPYNGEHAADILLDFCTNCHINPEDICTVITEQEVDKYLSVLFTLSKLQIDLNSAE